MVKPKILLCPGGDTPEQKPPSASTEEDLTRERVYGSNNLVMERVSVESDVMELNSEGFSKILDLIEEKASSILEFALQFDDVRDSEEERLRVKEIGRLSVLEEQEIESYLRHVIEATIIEGKKEEARRLFESINEKFCELDKAEKGFDLKQRAETERLNEESEAKEKKLRSLEEAFKEKTIELKRKEETFELKQKQEADKWREETELKRKGLEIKEKTLEDRLKELELKEMELGERSKQQVIVAECSRKRSTLELEPPLLVNNDSDADSLTRQAKKHKSQDADDQDIEQVVCTDTSVEDTEFNDFCKSMSSFAVDQVWALYDPVDDMPRIYANIREIFSSQLSLQVTLLERVKTTLHDKSILNACGRFTYGETEIKSRLMFAHEMHHITRDKDVIVNPRKGEKWALFRDWNTSWNSHPDHLLEPPYRYDYVEVISEFDDFQGIAVAYMGRVEGSPSVLNHAEQNEVISSMILPGEMQRFSHKVESVKLSREEKEVIPVVSFELNPAATPSYDTVLEEAVEKKIQCEDCGIAPSVEDHQHGSTKDQPIIIE